CPAGPYKMLDIRPLILIFNPSFAPRRTGIDIVRNQYTLQERIFQFGTVQSHTQDHPDSVNRYFGERSLFPFSRENVILLQT
ncbi:MAG: hypothetical protein ACM34H_08850, partial [Deltaproteobacteria bacterium]